MALTPEQYNAIMRIYDERNNYNVSEHNRRLLEVYKAIPKLRELDQELSELSLKRAESMLGFSGDNKPLNIDEYNKLSNDISNRRTALLIKNGFDPNYLDMSYTCSKCNDTGYINNEKCSCFKKLEIEFYYSQLNTKNINSDETFDNFVFDYYSSSKIDQVSGKSSLSNITDIYNSCLNFANGFTTNYNQNLLFHGEAGLGKTFLTNCIANTVIKNGFTVIYMTATEFFDLCVRVAYSKEPNLYSRMDDVMECDLLIIDDLGTEVSNTFTNSKLFACINDRMLRHSSTIISTNLSFKQICDQYSDRLFSRIIQSYKTFKFFGEDIRLKKRNS